MLSSKTAHRMELVAATVGYAGMSCEAVVAVDKILKSFQFTQLFIAINSY